MKEPINPPKETSKSFGKKSSSIVAKDSVNKMKISTFDVDESAVDIDIAKYNPIVRAKNPSEKPIEKKSDEIMQDQSNMGKSSDPRTKNKSNEEIAGEETEDIKLEYHEDSTSDVAKAKPVLSKTNESRPPIKCNKAPRRVQLITLSSPRELKKQ